MRPLRGTAPGRANADEDMLLPLNRCGVIFSDGRTLSESGCHGDGGALFTAPAFPCKDGAQVVWIADTGSANHFCSHDTLPGDVFEGTRPCSDVRLATASGIIEPEGQLEVYLTDLGVHARLLVPKDCPAAWWKNTASNSTGRPARLGSWLLLDDATNARPRAMSRTSAHLHHL